MRIMSIASLRLALVMLLAATAGPVGAAPEPPAKSGKEIADRVDALVAGGDCNAAFALLETTGDGGQVWAYLVLGDLHEIGPCAREDKRPAYEAHRKAVDGGYCAAYARMGYLEPHLTPGPIGLKLARRRYRAAALCLATTDLSDSKSLSLILRGLMFHREIPEDFRAALDWVRDIEQGSTEAKTDMALKLLRGSGEFPRLPETARLWLGNAARDGWAPAAFELGKALVDGTLGERKLLSGIRELILVANRGHREAMLTLGNIYASIDYGRFDGMKAFVWYMRAKAAGAQVDEALISQLKKSLSTREQHRAQYYLEGPPLGPSP